MEPLNWTKVTDRAEWQARDSAGEMVFKDRMWILGGWFTPQTPNPRDVWSSADGRHWTCAVERAPWEHGDLSAVMAFRDRMWLMGGRKLPGAENSNQVWSSADGATWALVSDGAGWCPRVSSAFAVFKDRMWVLGGTESFYDHSEAMVKSDVWSSADGRTWDLATPNADWSGRAHGQAVVFDGRLWIMGGGLWHPQHCARNDVWCTEDGERWTQVTPAAAWKPRLWFSALVYRDRMWVLGGWSKENGNFADVWVSKDGADWTQLACGTMWTKRHEHSAFVFQDKIWIAGGHAEPVNSEVWSLSVAADWLMDRGR
jgi:hypothetical protein